MLKVFFVLVKVDKTVNIVPIANELCLILGSELHEVRQANFLNLIRICRLNFNLLHIFLNLGQQIIEAIYDAPNFIAVFTLSYLLDDFRVFGSYYFSHHCVFTLQHFGKIIRTHTLIYGDLTLIFISPLFELFVISAYW